MVYKCMHFITSIGLANDCYNQDIEEFHHLKNNRLYCLFIVNSSSKSSLWYPLISVPTVFYFLEYHKKGIIQYVTFWGLFLSMRKMPLRVTSDTEFISHLLLFLAGYYYTIWMYHSLLIHSSVKRLLCCV